MPSSLDFGRHPSAVLGISADYHDSAAALVIDGEIIVAAEEERFTRLKHDPSLPEHAVRWCLEESGVTASELFAVAYYEKPLTSWERILMTHGRVGPQGFRSFRDANRNWMRSKLWIGNRIRALLRKLGCSAPHLVFVEHHQSHAAAAYYPSPFESAAIITLDGVGEWATSSISSGAGHRIEMLKTQHFPDSLGLLYSAMTTFCGFEANDGEYKLMGLAPYGRPKYVEVLRDRVLHLHDDGSVILDQRWFDYRVGHRMTNPRIGELLDGAALPLGQPPGEREADIAASVQQILEEAVLRTARFAASLTGEQVACLAGGVALNCVANARLLADGPFDDLWVQPAAGDSGSAIGAALWYWHQLKDQSRKTPVRDGMKGAALGPAYSVDEIADWLARKSIPFERYDTPRELSETVAVCLAEGKLVGWFQGRMEFGPRALGHRSILGDARDPSTATRLNSRVKMREGFRPFAPAVLAEHSEDWFDMRGVSPYMVFTAPVTSARRRSPPTEEAKSFEDHLGQIRSEIPACTHVDHSARLQTVDAENDPDFHMLIDCFFELTGVPVLLNTSLNLAGEPIARTPADALRIFEQGGLDLLVLEGCVVERRAVLETCDTR